MGLAATGEAGPRDVGAEVLLGQGVNLRLHQGHGVASL